MDVFAPRSPRDSDAPRSGWLACVLGSLLLCVFALAPAFACSPQEALAYRSPDVAAAVARLAAARAHAQALGWRTRSVLTGEETGGHDRYTLSLSLAPRPLDETTAARQVAESEQAVRRLERESIRLALAAHAALWADQAAETAARARRTRAEIAKAEVERKAGLGAVATLDAQEARLTLEEAQLSELQAVRALAAARRSAARYHLLGDATPSALHFRLPTPAPETLWDVQQARWEMRLAEARACEARRAVRPAIGLQVSYLGRHWQAITSLSTRTPSIDLLLGLPSLSDASLLQYQGDFFAPADEWDVTIQAELPLSPATRSAVRLAKAEVAAAKAHLERARLDLEVQLPRVRQEATDARERLALARTRVSLKLRLLDVVRARAAAGSASVLAVHDAEIAHADTAADMARAWNGYLEATARYLELADGGWEVDGASGGALGADAGGR
jgi:outer membrane protein TolC